MGPTLTLLRRFEARAKAAGHVLEPLMWFEIFFLERGRGTVLGLEIQRVASGERLWIRTLDHGRPSPFVRDPDGFWGPRDGGWRAGAGGWLGPAELEATCLDLEATQAWIQDLSARVSGRGTRPSLARALEALADLEAHVRRRLAAADLDGVPPLWQV